MNRTEEARTYLNSLYPLGLEEFTNCDLRISYQSPNHAHPQTRALRSIDAAAEMATMSDDTHFWLNMGLRDVEAKSRGGDADVRWIPCLWADVDIDDGSGAHAEGGNVFSKEEITRLLNQMDTPPTTIIDSGHGVYPLLILDEPYEVADPAEITTMLERYRLHIEERTGLVTDKVSDAARMLRIPGSFNLKSAPVPVRTLVNGGPRYGWTDVDDRLPTLPVAKPSTTTTMLTPAMGASQGRPGDDFNVRASWISDVLEPHGWTVVGQTTRKHEGEDCACGDSGHPIAYVLRPGDVQSAHSAVINWHGTQTMKVFSTSTPFSTSGTYSKFAAYTVLNHDGDHQAAARELGKAGYGEQREVAPEQATVPAKPAKIRSMKDLLTEEFATQRPWVVCEIIPPGVSLLFAGPKMGKSWFALQTGIAVAMGTKAFDLFPTDQGQVLYLALEDSRQRVAQRTAAILGEDHDYAGIENLHVVTADEGWPVLSNGGITGLEEWVASVPRPRLIVIDVLQKVRSEAGRGNAYAEDYKDMALLTGAAARLDTPVLVLHHTNKRDPEGDPFRTVSGTNAIQGAVDTLMHYRHLQESPAGLQQSQLQMRGRDIDDDLRSFYFDGKKLTAKATLTSPEQEEVYDIIRRWGPQTVIKIAGELHISTDAARKRLARMMNRGQIVRRHNIGMEDEYYIPGDAPRNESDFNGPGY